MATNERVTNTRLYTEMGKKRTHKDKRFEVEIKAGSIKKNLYE